MINEYAEINRPHIIYYITYHKDYSMGPLVNQLCTHPQENSPNHKLK